MARKPGKEKQLEVYIPSPDCWAPKFPDGTVCVRVTDRTNNSQWNKYNYGCCVHISVWGADDDGMELVVKFSTHREKNKAYRKWVKEVQSWKVVTKDMLRSLGFVQA